MHPVHQLGAHALYELALLVVLALLSEIAAAHMDALLVFTAGRVGEVVVLVHAGRLAETLLRLALVETQFQEHFGVDVGQSGLEVLAGDEAVVVAVEGLVQLVGQTGDGTGGKAQGVQEGGEGLGVHECGVGGFGLARQFQVYTQQGHACVLLLELGLHFLQE